MLQGFRQDLVLEFLSVKGGPELPGMAVRWLTELEDYNAALGAPL